MATIFRSPKKVTDPATGKRVPMIGSDGKPVMLPKWRTVIVDHKGVRRTITLSSNKQQAQKQADMLEQREREIKMGIRAVPTPQDKNQSRPFDDVFAEYMAWGRAQGGRRGMPWDTEHATKKERDILVWRTVLELKLLGDLYGILPRVEAECRAMLDSGNGGKTVSNKVLHLRSLILWCKKRKYLMEDPLEELGKFDTTPKRIRRAMLLDELKRLLRLCAPHRQLLYEVAACSGLRENELRQLEPSFLDRDACAIRIPKEIDKSRKERLQMIPSTLMARLVAFVESGEVFTLYNKAYGRQGKREGKKQPPENPLLYVPSNSATALKKDLLAAGIAPVTEKGYLDFHALRTAYINFVLDSGANVKTAQELARHSTPDMTMNVYGRARDEKMREAVETVGNMLFEDNDGQEAPDHGRENSRTFAERGKSSTLSEDASLATARDASKSNWCGREDLNLTNKETGEVSYPGLQGAFAGQEVSYPGQLEGDAEAAECKSMTGDVKSWTPDVTSVTHKSTKRLQNIYKTSLTLLAAIMRTPDLKALLIAWEKNLPPGAKNQILALVKSAAKLSGNNAIAGSNAQAGA